MVQAATKPWADVVPSLREKCMDGAAVIIFQGKNLRTTYVNGETVRSDEPVDVYMPFIVRGRDDVFHAETVRKSKGYGIVAIEHLDNLAKKKPDEARAIADMITRITRSPEVERKLSEANGKIAELEAKLSQVQSGSTAKAEADLKAEAEARAAAEARIAELEAKLAEAGSATEAVSAPEGTKKLEKK